MTSIPPNTVGSIAQTVVAQGQRAAENDAPEEAAARRSERQHRKQAESSEFVENTAEAAGLKVDPEGRSRSQAKKRNRRQSPSDEEDEKQQANPQAPSSPEVHDRSAALLAGPEDSDQLPPPPLMLDVEA